MVNSIRTPRLGTSATSRRIAEAVDDEDWQRFRLSMKGKPTDEKLLMLEGYLNYELLMLNKVLSTLDPNEGEKRYDDIYIRVDNYLKALARGGQLLPGACLQKALDYNWHLEILK